MKNILKTIPLILLIGITQCEKEPYQIYGTGTFEAREVLVSAQAMGQILEMPVEEGQVVQKDALIARIDVEKIELQKQQVAAGVHELNLNLSIAREQEQQAQIQFENIKTRYDRFKALFNQKSISQQQVDDLKSQYEVTEKNLKSARLRSQTLIAKNEQLDAQIALLDRQIADGTVHSPLDGIIIQKLKEPGEIVNPGGALVQIANLNEMEIKLYVAEIDLGKIKAGEELTIQVDSYPDRNFTGKIIWISPKAEFTPKNVQTKEARTNLVYAVKILVPNPEGILKIGMPADIFRK
jgi:HlyD family secretion protein